MSETTANEIIADSLVDALNSAVVIVQLQAAHDQAKRLENTIEE